ncbi:MAG: family oxidoreductase [Thermoleophilia bacterium]|nr:family oxidoreductase [Thermoleophilia bacterium]
METTDLTGRVALITGASSGIGASIAEAAVDAGMRVVLGARRVDRLEALAERLGGAKHAVAAQLDVTDWASCEAFVSAGLEAFGQVDAFVANAGFGAPRGWLESTPEHWRDMVLTNVYGCAASVRAAVPALLEAQGDIVLMSSVAGRRVLPGSLYSCTKHAVTAMAEALRAEFADAGVRVTSVEPGMVDTPFFDDGAPEWALHDSDIARAVLYALAQPPRACVSTVTVRPTAQVG